METYDVGKLVDELTSFGLTSDADIGICLREGGFIKNFRRVTGVRTLRGHIVIDATKEVDNRLAIAMGGTGALAGQLPTTAVSLDTSALSIQIDGDHYKQGGIQPIEFLEANPQIPATMQNVIRYASRVGSKGGVEGTLKDLRKIRHYCDLYEELHKDELNS